MKSDSDLGQAQLKLIETVYFDSLRTVCFYVCIVGAERSQAQWNQEVIQLVAFRHLLRRNLL